MATGAGRFAPSPSGTLHLGNLRTALLAWLSARSRGLPFLVRIEDLDRGRCRPEHEAGQLSDLAALGIDHDGGLMRQSERDARYGDALTQLEDAGIIYPCWCTRAEIREAASAPHGALPEGHYPGTCRDLGAAERAERERSGREPALRVRADAAEVAFDDRHYGARRGVVDDFVVRRGDGGHAYNLAVVVDDADQGVGEVVRGEDLLDSTPRQIWLAGRLGVQAPAFAHVPLILNDSGARLAKRDGAVTLADRSRLGEDELDVIGRLAWSVGLAARRERLDAAAVLSRYEPGSFVPPRSGPLPHLDLPWARFPCSDGAGR